MAFAYLFTPSPPMRADVYDRAVDRLDRVGAGNPPGRLQHVCFGARDAVRVLDVWETREDFDRFALTLGPILEDLGVGPGEPEITEFHNMIAGAPGTQARPASPVDTHKAAHAAFNRRDLHEAVRNFRPDAEYTDHARNLTTKGPAEFIDWLQGWIDSFSDARVDEPTYIDGGDHSVAMFQGRGTNDGPMGTFAASGHRLDVAFCEVMRYDASGRIAGGGIYYDAMSMLVQLGHMQPPGTG